jgi:hypothetical protein
VENVIEVRAIEVRYAGVVVGRSTKVRDWDSAGAFIGFAEPLPSGTSLVLRGDGIDQAARVVEVFESADPAVAGMQVKFVGAAEAARPAPKPAAAAAKPAPAVVTPPPATADQAPAAPAAAPAVAEAAPAVATDASASAVSGDGSGPATSEPGEGDAGPVDQSGQAGKRRRRRR